MHAIPSVPDRGIQSRSWFQAAVFAILVTLALWLIMGWHVGSSELTMSLLLTGLASWLILSLIRTSWRLPLRGLLVLMTLSALLIASLGQRWWFIRQQNQYIDAITQNGGKVEGIMGRTKRGMAGWNISSEGMAIPNWLAPLYRFFAPRNIRAMQLPTSAMTEETLALLRNNAQLSESQWLKGEGGVRLEFLLDGASIPKSRIEAFAPFIGDGFVRLEILDSHHLTDDDRAWLQDMSELTDKLSLWLVDPRPADLKAIQGIPLYHLQISQLQNVEGLSEALQPNPQARYWCIREATLGKEWSPFFQAFQDCRQLQLYNSLVAPEIYDALATLPKLEVLWADGVDDRRLQPLLHSSSLNTLEIRGSQVSDAMMIQLSQIPTLKKIRLHGGAHSWKAVQELCRQADLEEILVDSAQPSDGNFEWKVVSRAEIPQLILQRD